MSRYAEVILPLPLDTTFTYSIPEDMEEKIVVGSRVIVPFGSKKYCTAIVVGFPFKLQGEYEVKPISLLLDSRPVVRHPQLKLWTWIADYYLCAIGDVYKAALPSGLVIQSETVVEFNEDYEEEDDNRLKDNEKIVINLLRSHGKMSVTELEKALENKNISSLIKRLLEKEAVIVSEKLNERYRPKKVHYVKLTAAVEDAFKAVQRSQKQERVLLALLEMSKMHRCTDTPKEVEREQLLKRAGEDTTVVAAMVKKGIVETYVREVNRFSFNGAPQKDLPVLSDAQSEALDKIHKSWFDHDVTLLHGVTASGKTEIYIHLIDFVLRQGKRAFYLVPEIALTTQLTRRLQDVFGERVLIYHSKFTDNERVDVWNKLLEGSEPCVVIGARSAVFLPFGNLGLVIVDEEHEASYKQADPAPRYNGRDVAIVLAKMHGAKTLLGSATPSIETRYKAETSHFGLVELFERYSGAILPDVKIVDIVRARQRKEYSSPFAFETLKVAREALDAGNQVILFQNRRGYAPRPVCKMCEWTPKCDYCDVTMTYHRITNMLVCHYCGAMKTLPTVCPVCKQPTVEIYGYGTERIEDEVAKEFPDRKILRMDLDTTRNKDSYEQIISDFSAHKADILVGTQMVTKGLDFGNVTVVGVLNADNMIDFPDFRASERAFNMICQVAGRAGRREGTKGIVMIQTTHPQHPVVLFLKNNDYLGFYKHELEERKTFLYPPFTRIINIYLKHKDVRVLNHVSDVVSEKLRSLFGNRISNPEKPAVEKVALWYIRKMMLKVETGASMQKVKNVIRQAYLELCEDKDVKRTVFYYDVDPV